MKSSLRLQAGFTLLELMMVVFVVGIMAGLVVMSIGGNAEREFRRDAGRIRQVLVLARDEAPFEGEEIGFAIDPDGESYRFLRFDEKALAWQAIEKDGFTEHKFPQQYRVELDVSGQRVDLVRIYKDAYKTSDKLDNWLTEEKPKKKLPSPSLVFFSDGHYTPFRLKLEHPQVKGFVYVIEGDGLGDIYLRQADTGTRRKSKRG